jgi:hypothetical protein
MAFHKLNVIQEYEKSNYLNYFRSKILFAFLKLLDDEAEYKNLRQPLKFDDCDNLLTNKDKNSNGNKNFEASQKLVKDDVNNKNENFDNNDNNINHFRVFAIENTEFDKSIHTDALRKFIFIRKKNYTW